jgi:Domain of unknown function (DU1801)
MKSTASSVQEYLDELPADRRAVVSAVREVVLQHLPAGYREAMGYGMITYEIPLGEYPNTYNKQPLAYLALAAQKHHYSLYLMAVYENNEEEARLREGFRKARKKLDMGKSCVRFRKLEDLPLDLIGEIVASTPPAKFVAIYEMSRSISSRSNQGDSDASA